MNGVRVVEHKANMRNNIYSDVMVIEIYHINVEETMYYLFSL